MSQPPYPPQGGDRPGDDDPTRRFGAPPPGVGEGQRDETRQFDQPPYGPPPYGPPGQPSYGQGQPPAPQPYGPPGQPPYGQPPYGPPPYGQPPYGQPPYGQPPYAQPPYGQPPYGQPAKGRNGTVIALVVAGVVVLAAVGIALWLLLGNGDDPASVASDTSVSQSSTEAAPDESTTSSSSSSSGPADESTSVSEDVPAGSVPPDGLGDDGVFDGLAQGCYDGDMTACDALYEATKDDASYSAYNEYADTCAGRQQSGTSVYCTDAFPGS